MPLPRIPVTDGLEAVLYVRANRVGVQLYARVVLPEDIDPETRAPVVRADPGHDLRSGRSLAKARAHESSAQHRAAGEGSPRSSRRPVSLKGAYLERLVVNLMGASGAFEVFLDDLSITPVAADIVAEWSKRAPGKNSQRKEGSDSRRRGEPASRACPRSSSISIACGGSAKDDRRYHDWLPTAIDAPGADVVMLRQYGFDVLTDDHRGRPRAAQDRRRQGFPAHAQAVGTPGREPIPQEIIKQISAYPLQGSGRLLDAGRRPGPEARAQDPRRGADQDPQAHRADASAPERVTHTSQPRSSTATCRSSPGRLATSTRSAFSPCSGLPGKTSSRAWRF